MRALVTALAILAILIPVAGMVLRKSRGDLPRWYFWLLAVVALALAAGVSCTQLL
ncbi:hypothetical protein GCM10010315_06770 [Streptomyces luteosporeus]|uniref:Uncharacterized protein n=1 Tax=Streptomyces luteosporeus TaxID=173856 RepID=A0ABP6G0N3_9ACTN